MKYKQSVTTAELVRSIDEPASKAPLSHDQLVRLVSAQAALGDPGKEQAKIIRRGIACFRRSPFTGTRHVSEDLIAEFLKWMSSTECAPAPPKKLRGPIACAITKLINGAADRSPGWNRPLLSTRSFNRRDQLRNLSSATRAGLVGYKRDAKKARIDKHYVAQPDGTTRVVRKFTPGREPLTGYSKANRIGRFLQFSELLNVRCASEVTSQMLEQFLAERPGFANKMLTELESVFANFHASELIVDNPLSAILYGPNFFGDAISVATEHRIKPPLKSKRILACIITFRDYWRSLRTRRCGVFRC